MKNPDYQVLQVEASQSCSDPKRRKVVLLKDQDSIFVVKPSPGWKLESLSFLIGGLCWTLIATVLLATFIRALALYGNARDIILVILFLIVVVTGLVTVVVSVKHALTSQVLHIGPQKYAIWNKVCFRIKDMPMTSLDDPGPRQALGDTSELSLAELIPEEKAGFLNGGKITPPYIQLKGGKDRRFGCGLDLTELKRIVQEVNMVISQTKSKS